MSGHFRARCHLGEFGLLRGENPPDTAITDNDQPIGEVSFAACGQEGAQKLQHICRGCRIDFEPYDTGVFRERQDGPVPEVLIESQENAVLSNALGEDLVVIGARHADLGKSDHIVAVG
ncbi:MAG: hypothetical protein O3B01_31900 [Planctomycetota bacterium]|nr:hypothetical protein [Planctomycetota bacterium]